MDTMTRTNEMSWESNFVEIAAKRLQIFLKIIMILTITQGPVRMNFYVQRNFMTTRPYLLIKIAHQGKIQKVR